jgi:hypothetical protein
MNRARRLKRVFGIEIEQCVRCGGRLNVIASIEEPEVIERILAHRRERGEGGGAEGLARGASAAAGVVVLIRLILDGLVFFGAGSGGAARSEARGARRPRATAELRARRGMRRRSRSTSIAAGRCFCVISPRREIARRYW